MMEYQTSALWFYKPLPLLAAGVSLALSWMGFSAGLGYMLLTGLFWPILIAMYLHRQKENMRVWSPQENSEWLVYVNAIPVREQRSVLTNPGFSSPAKARRFFQSAFLLKFILQAGCLTLAVWQFIAAPWDLYAVVGSLVLLLPLAAAVWRTGQRLATLNELQFAEISHPNGQIWHQAQFVRSGKTLPALKSLLSLF
ncbi:hypothetical protein [[Enterobacter] lignolyticus]|uniref:Uncharacterized protein n=1 Tax=Enterobacter lignolyticus (strain SCF1) TaxID=701347 RepID=E3G4J4_ENTLS|nr:hypothetical protein [[Enterobacter] lignolyticus]ADO49388.1 hypothetical protein Entcl_3142 [[Enterobacter] lignolyticus SCF1]